MNEAIEPGIYRHFKGGLYEVLGIARHSETEEHLVIYRPVTGDGTWWARPRDMFREIVPFNGDLVPRFQRIESESRDNGSGGSLP